jgi:hypothetical protein
MVNADGRHFTASWLMRDILPPAAAPASRQD